jgi:hypothetical protein
MANFEIVQPIDGAPRVVFDYGAAGRALDAYSAMARVLDSQAQARVGPHDAVIVNWNGHFKERFEEAWNLLQARFTAGVEGASYGPGQIYDAIFEANERQRTLNHEHEGASPAPR